MTNLATILNHAERRCQNNGSRLTAKRKQVLAGLIESQKALSAYELLDFCRERYGKALPPMSVYRILDFLESENLVHKLNIANKYAACTHIACRHAHAVPQFLICDSCSRVSEVSLEPKLLNTLSRNVSNAGYTLRSQQLEMSCRCNACSQ